MIYQPLLDDIVDGKCLPVIGAGFSKNATLSDGGKMPDWNELAKKIGGVLKTNKTEPMEILQEYEDKFGRNRLIQEIEKIIPVNGVILGEIHKYFVRISPFDLIYTTNFDLLLEKAFEQENKRTCKPLVGEKQLATYASPPTVNIVKMHGDLRHQEYLVLTKNDYNEYLTRYAAIATHLSASLITRTPLYIGYSLTDPNFRQIREIIQNRLGEFTKRGYIVLFDPTQQEIDDYNKLHLVVIELKLNGRTHSEVLLEFLKEICDYTTNYFIKKDSKVSSEFEGIIEETKIGKTVANQTQTNDGIISQAIKSIATTEIDISNALKKRGVEEKDLKKSLTGLSVTAFKLGLLSSSDLGLVRDIMGVRNEFVHRGKQVSDDQAKWIIKSTEEIKEKISSKETVIKEKISITISVDSANYTDGDFITITGRVKPVIVGIPINIQILDPEGMLVQIIQSEPDENGLCVPITKAIGAAWELDGEYTVRAQYGLASVIAEDKFRFRHRIPRVSDIYYVTEGIKTFEVKYSIRGGSIRHIEADPDMKSLQIMIESNQDGDVVLEIPRELIDVKLFNNEDDKFLVTIDGEEVNYIESKTTNSRNLTIRFLKGDYAIEIIGNKTHPLERIHLSNLMITDEGRNPIREIIPNHPILISASLLNNQINQQKYTFIVQILKNGITVDIIWVEGVLRAGLSSESHVTWTPNDSGEFDIQAFVWETIENPSALSPPLHLKINIHGKDQVTSIKPNLSAEEIMSNLDTIIETYSGFPPTKNQLNEAIKLYDICWQWVKEKFPSKYEVNLLKTKPVSFIRLFAVPNPSRELRAVTDELILKAKRLKKIIPQKL